LKRTGAIWDRNERIKINDNWDKLEVILNSINGLVIDGKLTSEQFAELQATLNGLVKKGEVSLDDLTHELRNQINLIENKISKGYVTKTDLSAEIIENLNTIYKVADRVDDIISGQDLNANKDIEIVDARKGFDTLRDKIDVIDSQLKKLGSEHILIKNDAKNGDFENDLSDWDVTNNTATIVDEGMVSNKSLKLSRSMTVNATQNLIYDVGDILYVQSWVKPVNINTMSSLIVGVTPGDISSYAGYVNTTQSDQESLNWVRQSLRVETTTPNLKVILRCYTREALKEGLFDGILVVNLTKAFGKNNEPTKEEFEHILEAYPNYYFSRSALYLKDVTTNNHNGVSYDERGHTVVDVSKNGIDSTGAVDFTEKFKELLDAHGGNTTYVFPKGVYTKKTPDGIP